jgi:hypothetical protein
MIIVSIRSRGIPGAGGTGTPEPGDMSFIGKGANRTAVGRE